jgi:hypothetical protein
MDALNIEKINGSKKIHGIYSLLTMSFASFSISAVIILVVAIFAITNTYIDEIWLAVLEISTISAGILLLTAALIAIKKQSTGRIIGVILITIPILSAFIPMIPLQWNFRNFSNHFTMVGIYPHLKNYMWKEMSYLLESSILIILAFAFLVIIKISQKKVKKELPHLIIGSISLLVILPAEIIGFVISKFDNTYEIGVKMFWGALIVFVVISLSIFYYIIKEIEAVSYEKNAKSNQILEENVETSNRTNQLLVENNAKIMIIFGALCIIASMIWFVILRNNQDLVYFRYENLPDSAFPEFALYGFGTTLIAYSLLKWLKVKKQQFVTIIIAIIGIAIIIPMKILSIYLVWKWGAENLIYTMFGWTTKVKPLVIVLSDLIPLAIALLCISLAIWRMKNKEMKSIWLLIIPIITMTTAIIYLVIVIWQLWGNPAFDLNNFFRMFIVSNIIIGTEIVFLIVTMTFEFTMKKRDLGI